METRFGTVITWPGDLPPRLYISDTSQLLSSVLGSASKCPLAQSRPLTKRGKYVLWSPPAQAPVSKSGYEFQTLHLFRTLHPRGASCPSTIFWISFFTGDRKAALTNLPLFNTCCLWGMVYFEHLPSWTATFPESKAHCCFLVKYSVCVWTQCSRRIPGRMCHG